jgi:hypothetical protein
VSYLTALRILNLVCVAVIAKFYACLEMQRFANIIAAHLPHELTIAILLQF